MVTDKCVLNNTRNCLYSCMWWLQHLWKTMLSQASKY